MVRVMARGGGCSGPHRRRGVGLIYSTYARTSTHSPPFVPTWPAPIVAIFEGACHDPNIDYLRREELVMLLREAGRARLGLGLLIGLGLSVECLVELRGGRQSFKFWCCGRYGCRPRSRTRATPDSA